MAQRITESWLLKRLAIAQKVLQQHGYPVHGEYKAPFRAGCLMLDHSGCYGYALEMTFKDGCSGVVRLVEGLTAKEMDAFLDGIIALERIQHWLGDPCCGGSQQPVYGVPCAS